MTDSPSFGPAECFPPETLGRFALLLRKDGAGAQLVCDFGTGREIRFPQPLFCYPDYAPEHRGCWLAWDGGGRVFIGAKSFTASPRRLAQALLDAGFVFNATHARLLRDYAATCYGPRMAVTPGGPGWAEPALDLFLSKGGK